MLPTNAHALRSLLQTTSTVRLSYLVEGYTRSSGTLVYDAEATARVQAAFATTPGAEVRVPPAIEGAAPSVVIRTLNVAARRLTLPLPPARCARVFPGGLWIRCAWTAPLGMRWSGSARVCTMWAPPRGVGEAQ